MKIALITGSSGLVGSSSAKYLTDKFDLIIGIDNDKRSYFYGVEGSTNSVKNELLKNEKFIHYEVDIRDFEKVNNIFNKYNASIELIIHAAAQPSHDWAVNEPMTDFEINAMATLQLLELTRKFCKDAVFIYVSTNKVYGDSPNFLPFVESETRWEIDQTNQFHELGINESMSIDNSTHSLFGVSKLSADLYTQEYSRYFGLKTAVFRCGCITGSNHAGTTLHGFLSYLIKCLINKKEYTIIGYKGKQVRDIIYADDLASAFYEFYKKPTQDSVFNMGGGRFSNCSIIEAMSISEKLSGLKFQKNYIDLPRKGDHIWYISDVSKFQNEYPNWKYTINLEATITNIIESELKALKK